MPTGRDPRSSASRRSRAPPSGTPFGMLVHIVLRAPQVLRRVDREPDALMPKAAQLAFGRELGERALLVVALFRETRQCLLAERVDAGVHPVVEQRRLAKAGDA